MTDERPVVAVTGQRPQHMTPEQREFARAEIVRVTKKLSEGFEVGVSGMALGTDQWFALACIQNHMTIEAHLPFPKEDQQKFWNETDRALHEMLLSKSESIITYADAAVKFDLIPAYHRRNQGMVDRVAAAPTGIFIAVTNGKGSGGTWDCLHRIAAVNVEVVLIHTQAKLTRKVDRFTLAEALNLDPARIEEHRAVA